MILPFCQCSEPYYREEDQSRLIPSTGDRYTVEKIEPGLYRYKYLPHVCPTPAGQEAKRRREER